jgi:hypothetical protein
MQKGRGDGGIGFRLRRGGVQAGRLASAQRSGQRRRYLASRGRRSWGAGLKHWVGQPSWWASVMKNQKKENVLPS